MATKKVIIIAGPTAVGKTSAAIEVAQHFGTEIISADSRQCYKELNIGVARPSKEELSAVPHHFIASHSVHDKIDAACFENYALQKAEELFQKNDTVVMVGGTGLYIKAFCEGMDAMPEVPEEIQNEVRKNYKEKGLEWLQQQVQQHDPAFYKIAETQNPQRLMRALEIFLTAGQSFLQLRQGRKAERDFEIVKIALELPRQELYQRINHRVDVMMQQGLLEEARTLFPHRYLNALQTVGYKEMFSFINNEVGVEEAVELIKRNTRHYAKRQLTWFRKDKDYQWLLPKNVKKHFE
jgi:tRNA dimethylallyltransferase